MVVVKIELWPGGDSSRAREIGRVNIANDMTRDQDRGNYNCALSHAGSYYGKPGAWKTSRVTNHLRRLSPYHLVYQALKNALYPSHK